MNLHAGSPDIGCIEHGLSELAQVVTYRQQVGGDHDALELGNKNSIFSGVVPDADVSATRILSQNIGDVVGRNSAQHRCWGRMYSHFRTFSLPKARMDDDRKVIWLTLNLKLNKKHGYRAPPSSISTLAGGTNCTLSSADATPGETAATTDLFHRQQIVVADKIAGVS